jgi:hypothetical protein
MLALAPLASKLFCGFRISIYRISQLFGLRQLLQYQQVPGAYCGTSSTEAHLLRVFVGVVAKVLWHNEYSQKNSKCKV